MLNEVAGFAAAEPPSWRTPAALTLSVVRHIVRAPVARSTGERVFIHLEPVATPLHTLPLDVLMAPRDAGPEDESRWDELIAGRVPNRNPFEELGNAIARRSAGSGSFAHAPGYGYEVGPPGSRLLAVFHQPTGALVGGFLAGNLFIAPSHRGKGLGREAVIAAFETGVVHAGPYSATLSTAGRANRRSAHRAAVERALAAGVTVGDEVMADYPDLDPGLSPGRAA